MFNRVAETTTLLVGAIATGALVGNKGGFVANLVEGAFVGEADVTTLVEGAVVGEGDTTTLVGGAAVGDVDVTTRVEGANDPIGTFVEGAVEGEKPDCGANVGKPDCGVDGTMIGGAVGVEIVGTAAGVGAFVTVGALVGPGAAMVGSDAGDFGMAVVVGP